MSKVRAYDGTHQVALQGGRALAHLLVQLQSGFFTFLKFRENVATHVHSASIPKSAIRQTEVDHMPM
jgi:hypothetical protein